MCDTLVALGNVTADGAVIFAKNSDREPNEAQFVEHFPAADHPEGEMLACTYISIPQAAHTHAVLLSRPFWMWGAEMGANAHGVVIGNEAVFTRVPYEKGAGLTGMDLLRLGLERASSASEALQVIIRLLETYGQGGNCGFTHGFYYHNSFLIADPREAWVLETAGKQWAAEKVVDIRTISNAITIGKKWDMASAGLVDYALEKGWCKRREDFDFAACYSDPLYTSLSDANKRRCATRDQLRGGQGKIDVRSAMQILRSHTQRLDGSYKPDAGILGADVCMHAGFGPVRNSQSAGSLVSHLGDTHTHWVTATAAPCTGIFKPVWVDAGVPDYSKPPTGEYSADALWWRHELLHREVLRDYPTRLSAYANLRDALEDRFINEAETTKDLSCDDRLELSRRCFEDAETARLEWLEQVRLLPIQNRLSLPYALAWKRFNKQARLSA